MREQVLKGVSRLRYCSVGLSGDLLREAEGRLRGSRGNRPRLEWITWFDLADQPHIACTRSSTL